MAKITSVVTRMVDLKPQTVRVDAIQSFESQETPLVTIHCDDGSSGSGYSYTIGTGGSSVMALIEDHLAPALLGEDPERIEHIWKKLHFRTHATAVGAITSLALAAIDTALWDRRSRVTGIALSTLLGGAQTRVPLYTTEGGWLHLSEDALVADALASKAKGFKGCKIKVGKADPNEDVARIRAVREAVGTAFEIMVDANQAFRVDEAIRRARLYEPLDIAWFEEPLPAEDLGGHIRLCQSTTLPIAVGESMYHPWQFREYLQQGACSLVQVDVARVGGISPWLKVAHMAETFNVSVSPHFLMELHVSLSAAVPNGRWVEYIPQLDAITTSRMRIEDGFAIPSDKPGLGIEWDWQEIDKRLVRPARTIS